MELTSKNVEMVFNDCLFDDGEDTDSAVIVDGLLNKFSFNSDRLESRKDDIYSMLSDLPDEFNKKSGGGYSFLKACYTKVGEQWTDLHSVMEKLFCLGIGIGKVNYLMPRKMWQIFPGGMPYLVIE